MNLVANDSIFASSIDAEFDAHPGQAFGVFKTHVIPIHESKQKHAGRAKPDTLQFDYELYDVVFNLYLESRDRSLWKIREYYYTVFCAKLKREASHLVFDSIKAKGQ